MRPLHACAALVSAVCALGASARGQTAAEAFAEGTRAYRQAATQEGEARTAAYRVAASHFARAAALVPNPYTLFDLGNALFRAGDVGRAIGAYRRAELLMPRSASLRKNLALARDGAPGGGTAPRPHPAAAAFFFWHYALSLAEAEALCALSFVLCMAALSARLFAPARRRASLRAAAIALGALAAVMAASSVAKLASSERAGAVVVARQTSVRSEPAGRAVELSVLREGAEVRVVTRAGDWTRIESGTRARGWVETRALDVFADAPAVPAGAPL